MLDSLKWFTLKRDVAPGTLVYAGRKREFEPEVSSLVYNADGILEEACPVAPANVRVSPETTTLLHCVGVHDPAMIRAMGSVASIPAIVLEDVMNTAQRPKLEWLENGIFLILRDMAFDESANTLNQQQVSLFWNDNVVLLFQETDTRRFRGVMERVRTGSGKMRGAGGHYLAVALIDAIIDNHFATLHAISERAQALEDALQDKQTEKRLNTLYTLRREAVVMRNALLPMREMFRELSSAPQAELPPPAEAYLRDVGDHATQAADSVLALADIMTGMIELQISLAGLKTNRIMQVLTLVATIFIPLTFIAGVYGMNFEFMPELKWRYGYFIALGAMGVTAVGMLALFLRNKWL